MAVKKATTQTNVEDVYKENELLKETNKKLGDEMAEIRAMMQMLMSNQNKSVEVQNKIDMTKEEDMDIPMNKVVKVISTTYGGMTLKTAESGGKSYRFHDFGAIQPIMYSDILGIISNHPKASQEGYFLILDSKVAEASGMGMYYEKFLTKDKIVNILKMESDEISEVFQGTTKHMQEVILETIYKQIGNHEHIDRNKVSVISNIIGRDVFELAEIYNNGIKEIK